MIILIGIVSIINLLLLIYTIYKIRLILIVEDSLNEPEEEVTNYEIR